MERAVPEHLLDRAPDVPTGATSRVSLPASFHTKARKHERLAPLPTADRPRQSFRAALGLILVAEPPGRPRSERKASAGSSGRPEHAARGSWAAKLRHEPRVAAGGGFCLRKKDLAWACLQNEPRPGVGDRERKDTWYAGMPVSLARDYPPSDWAFAARSRDVNEGISQGENISCISPVVRGSVVR